jgi:hypothetical protein
MARTGPAFGLPDKREQKVAQAQHTADPWLGLSCGDAPVRIIICVLTLVAFLFGLGMSAPMLDMAVRSMMSGLFGVSLGALGLIAWMLAE